MFCKKSHFLIYLACVPDFKLLACSRYSDSREQWKNYCDASILWFFPAPCLYYSHAMQFTLPPTPLSERLEQARKLLLNNIIHQSGGE